MQFPTRLLAVAVTAAAAVRGAAVAQTDEPPCPVVPQDFWNCINYCLYQLCADSAPSGGVDPACYDPCEADCRAKWTPGCEPGIWRH
ncbi:hypothetical protein VTK26DRAFT_4509 [Humicola hyalothermophila]